MQITFALTNDVLSFAAEELRRFLGDQPGWQFDFVIDPSLPLFAFAVNVVGERVTLSGHDSTGVLHAAYTALEQVGYCFEISGARLARDLDLSQLRPVTICPAVNWRGIRQHLNFPMDISSYPLAEALEYLRNLVRLRLNHITFHSYPDQWYAVELSSGRMLAGSYFYGQRHDIPDHPIIRRAVRNQRTFCIPECEPFIDDAEANSRLAIQWLQAVMSEAKRVGLRIQFSFELREQNLTDSLMTVDAILATYPLIDMLEIITQESGVWGYVAPPDDLRRLTAETFGADALDDPAIAANLRDGQHDLDRLIREIGRAVEVCKALQASDRDLPGLALGVYCTVPADHAVILRLMQRYVPPGVSFAFLLDHGNRAVARNLRDLNMPRADWERAMIYSWIEFDGTMYILQNPVEGIRQLIALAQAVHGGDPVQAVSFNHWRTAENRTAARYASVALLHGAVAPGDFYRAYAESLGIDAGDHLASALQYIDDADSQARDELPNVGFCYVGVWGTQGLGYFGVFKQDRLVSVREKYEAALDHLRRCSTERAEGRRYLAFLANRIQCTIIYLQAIEDAVALQPICAGKSPDQLGAHDQAQVRAICDRALAGMERYMALHADAIEDRGCEGILISFYYTPPAVLRRIRAEYGGTGETVAASSSTDAPPSPISVGGH